MNGVHLTKKYYKYFLPTDLQWPIEKIDDDFTLYDLFMLVEYAHIMMPRIFATMGMSEFNSFWKQIQLDRDPGDDNEVDYLELFWSVEYDIRTSDKTGKDTDQNNSSLKIDTTKNYWDDTKSAELSNLMGFHGIGKGCPVADLDHHGCGDDCPQTTAYAVEFTPLNNLAHLPIRVSPTVHFFPPYVESDKEFHRTGFKLNINPTLWCFITSIFWELTFAGATPNDVAKHRSEIIDSVDEAKNTLNKMDEKNEDCPFID